MSTGLRWVESAIGVGSRLWDRTYAPANLQRAFHKVWQNGGSAGADRQTVAHFARHAEEELSRLAEQMSDGTYRPQPGRRAWLPKPGSSEKRPLGIPAVRDPTLPGAVGHGFGTVFQTAVCRTKQGFPTGG